MALFTTASERKSLVITSIISAALIIALFFLGLHYMEPPEESGIAINFGTTNSGAGDLQPDEPIRTAPSNQNETQTQNTEAVEAPPPEPSTSSLEEEVISQETEEAPVIEEKVEEPKTTTPTETEPEEEPEPQKEEPIEEEVKEEEPDPQPDQSTTDALNSILNGNPQDGGSGQGEGDDANAAGDKGSPDGNRNAASYYGQGEGLDGDGNYRLGGRKALNKKKYVQDCNESGTVVVEIKVNREGQVVRATPGVKGTTNMSGCLLDPARRAAQETSFNPDSKAPSIQTGHIIYEFRLSD